MDTHILVPIDKFNSYPEDDTCDMVDFVRSCKQVDLSEDTIRKKAWDTYPPIQSVNNHPAIGYQQAIKDLLQSK